jgi:hypothetical protein
MVSGRLADAADPRANLFQGPGKLFLISWEMGRYKNDMHIEPPSTYTFFILPPILTPKRPAYKTLDEKIVIEGSPNFHADFLH